LIQAVSGYVRNLVILVFLVTFLEMLAPENGLKRFVQVTIGFFVLVAMLSPLLNLVNTGKQRLEDASINDGWQASSTTATAESDGDSRLAEVNRALVDGLTARQLSRLVEAEVRKAAPGFEAAIETEMVGEEVSELLVKLRGNPGEAEGPSEEDVERRVAAALAEGLGIARERVVVEVAAVQGRSSRGGEDDELD
jgi:stage III sporulation protein AF